MTPISVIHASGLRAGSSGVQLVDDPAPGVPAVELGGGSCGEVGVKEGCSPKVYVDGAPAIDRRIVGRNGTDELVGQHSVYCRLNGRLLSRLLTFRSFLSELDYLWHDGCGQRHYDTHHDQHLD